MTRVNVTVVILLADGMAFKIHDPFSQLCGALVRLARRLSSTMTVREAAYPVPSVWQSQGSHAASWLPEVMSHYNLALEVPEHLTHHILLTKKVSKSSQFSKEGNYTVFLNG